MFMKLLKTNDKKIFFLSRQSKELSLDYKMLIDEIKCHYSDYKVVSINCMIEKGILNKIKYTKVLFVEMYHLATCKTCVIDGYNIPVSVLRHKKNMKVIQIWHSLAAIKKFGYQTLDKECGSSSKVAKLMKMHYNYDLVVSGSKAMIPYFSEAFNTEQSKFITCGLPRIDYLIKENDNNKNKILNKYPQLKEKKVILYVPTFRKNKEYYLEKMIEMVDKNKYELIIKGHPLKKLNNAKISEEFTSLELLSIADYVITDYSAISIEALVINKPIYFYLYDLDEYSKNVGLNINLEKEFKSATFKDFKGILDSIENDKYSKKEYNKFKKKYLDNTKGNATEILVKHIVGEL